MDGSILNSNSKKPKFEDSFMNQNISRNLIGEIKSQIYKY